MTDASINNLSKLQNTQNYTMQYSQYTNLIGLSGS